MLVEYTLHSSIHILALSCNVNRFGTWCTWLLVARTVESLELGRSLVYTSAFWCGIGLLLISFVAGGLDGAITMAVLFSVGYTVVNAIYRTRIRQKFQIAGDSCGDCCVHFCCDSAGAIQEFQEARYFGAPQLDFCSGEPISDIKMKNQSALGNGNEDHPIGGTFSSHFSSLSITSSIIIGLNLLIFSVVVLSQFILHNYYNVLLLCLLFLQPLLILYFVYWRRRRATVSLDAVVKMFTVGFYFTTFQAICIELLLQLGIGAILQLIAAGTNVMRDSTNSGTMVANAILLPARNGMMALAKYMSNNVEPVEMSVVWPQEFIMTVLQSSASDNSTTDDYVTASNEKRAEMKHNIVLVFISLILMVLSVNFLRCCSLKSPLGVCHRRRCGGDDEVLCGQVLPPAAPADQPSRRARLPHGRRIRLCHL